MNYKYFVWEETPLKFYKILRVLLLLFSVASVISIGYTIWLIKGYETYYYSYEYFANSMGDYYRTSIFFACISLLLNVAAAILLFKRRWDGVICFLVNIVWAGIASAVSQSFLGGTAASYLGILLGVAVLFIPIYIYFKKRRPVFFPTIAPPSTNISNVSIAEDVPHPARFVEPCKAHALVCNNPKETLAAEPGASIKIDISAVENEPLMHYCRKCGTKLAEESLFCHKCGTKAMKE